MSNPGDLEIGDTVWARMSDKEPWFAAEFTYHGVNTKTLLHRCHSKDITDTFEYWFCEVTTLDPFKESNYITSKFNLHPHKEGKGEYTTSTVPELNAAVKHLANTIPILEEGISPGDSMFIAHLDGMNFREVSDAIKKYLKDLRAQLKPEPEDTLTILIPQKLDDNVIFGDTLDDIMRYLNDDNRDPEYQGRVYTGCKRVHVKQKWVKQ